MPNVETLLRDHTTLNVECIDRLYLNGYVPLLQRPQNLWWFFHEHRQQPVLSPVLLKRLSDSFVARIHGFAKRERVPIVRFEKGARKEEVARKRLARHPISEGVVMIGVAQEKVSGFRLVKKGKKRQRQRRSSRPPCYSAYRGSICVNQYYFYIVDRDFGLCFLKFSSYVPFGVKVWLNGHEWAKRQIEKKGIPYLSLENGFFAWDDPQLLQKTCDSLAPAHVDRFFRKWLRKLPHPFSREDRRAGFLYRLSILQMEMSLTQVFDRPLHGRQFFEEKTSTSAVLSASSSFSNAA